MRRIFPVFGAFPLLHLAHYRPLSLLKIKKLCLLLPRYQIIEKMQSHKHKSLSSTQAMPSSATTTSFSASASLRPNAHLPFVLQSKAPRKVSKSLSHGLSLIYLSILASKISRNMAAVPKHILSARQKAWLIQASSSRRCLTLRARRHPSCIFRVPLPSSHLTFPQCFVPSLDIV